MAAFKVPQLLMKSFSLNEPSRTIHDNNSHDTKELVHDWMAGIKLCVLIGAKCRG